MATRGCIARVIAILSIEYTEKEIDDQMPELWVELLGDIPDGVLMAAVKLHITRSKWFPKISELRQAAQDIQAQADGLLTPEEAWIQVNKAVSSIGSWGTPEFDDLTQMAIDGLGGWRMLCQSTNPAADRAHFDRIYKGLLQRQQASANMLPEVRAVIEALQGEQRPQLEGGGK